MYRKPLRPNLLMAAAAFIVLFGIMMACARGAQPEGFDSWNAPAQNAAGTLPFVAVQAASTLDVFQGPRYTPTPDAPHPLPALRTDPDSYVVQPGDTLGQIAKRYGVNLAQIVQENQLANPNLLEVGQVLTIPVPTPEGSGPNFKIIPDSELVYGPASVTFDIPAFVQSQNGYLARHQEEVEGRNLSGAQIVERVALDFSVNPRLLLAVLQYQSGWLTKPEPQGVQLDYPIGLRDPNRKGLYRQLAFAANQLNRGYYVWRVNGAATWLLSDGAIVPIDPTINAGTAGVQNLFAALYGQAEWLQAVSENGVFAVYDSLFGYPFHYATEPLLPPDLSQPTMQLPFEVGYNWAFTGGPHGAWGDGSAWAALDFAPPSDLLGCIPSDHWIVAIADGVITRAGGGAVVQDLDGDGFEQTGWAVLYMHVETRNRVQPGTLLKAGERIGHPSCEGGISTGTHVHVARKYNGEWIPADQDIPFVLDGWMSKGDGFEYNGFLLRNGQSVEAYAGRSSGNGIQR